MKYDAVIFDFDGTVADTAEGIFSSVRYALRTMGYPQAPEQTLRKFIGPPLVYSFQNFIGMPQAEAERAVVIYRNFYGDSGKYMLYFYPGIPELMCELHNAGIMTGIASAKPDLYIRQILEHFKMDHLFDVVQGVTMEEKSADKSGVIETVIRRLGVADLSRVLMVGDTPYDIRGAKKVGIDSLGVLYGYGAKEDLIAENADHLANDPQEIMQILNQM